MSDYRDWIEFGKMFERINSKFDNSIELFSDDDEYVIVITDDYNDDIIKSSDTDLFKAMKELYFRVILGVENSEEIELDLPEEEFEKLYELSDDTRVPVDEIINDILKKAIDENKAQRQSEISEREQILKDINDIEKEWIEKIPTSDLKEYYEVLKKIKR